MPFLKQGEFTKKVSDLPNAPSPQYTAAEIKEHYDTPANELKTTINKLVDDLNVDGWVNDKKIATRGVKRENIELGAIGTDELDPAIIGQPITDFGIQAKFQSLDMQLSQIAINIKNFGVVGDGIIDDTDAINIALSYCKTNNYPLLFPEGEYNTVGNLNFFHDVVKVGNGVVKRGTDKFYITPSSEDINIIYAGFGGLNGNDGLSSTQPRTLSSVLKILQNLGDKASKGQWRVQFVAGTITDTGLVFDNLPYFSKPLQFWGVWDGSNRLSVWDGSLSTAKYAFRADGKNGLLNLEFKDLKFENWSGDPSNAGAIVCWYGVNVTTENVEVKDSTVGIWMRGGFSRHYGDVLDNCVWAYGMQYNHSGQIGNSTQRVTIKNCDKGLMLGRQSVTHVDYTDFSNNIVDVNAHQKSRFASIGSTFANWSDVSIWLQGDSIFEDGGSCTWDATSITDTTPIYRFDNGSSVPSVHLGALPYRESHFAPSSGYTLTGTTAETLLTGQPGFGALLRIPKQMLYNNGSLQIKIEARIDVNGTGGTKRVRLTGGGTSNEIAFIDIPSTSGGLGFLTFELTFRTDGSVLVKSKYESNVSALNVLKFNTVSASTMNTIRDKTQNLTLWRLYGSLTSASDTLSIFSLTTTIVG